MFFPERISAILETDKILEIGPGSTPFYRSDVFLELRFDDERKAISQRGEIVESFETDKPVFYYDGHEFPFMDKEFDYIVCSHVIEHVPNVEQFINECIRVGRKGYFEYPTIYFEFIYDIKVHLNILKYNSNLNCLFFKSKSELMIESFLPVQQFLSEGMKKGYLSDLYKFIIQYSIESFEWEDSFKYKKADSLEDLCENNFNHIPVNLIKNSKKNFFLRVLIYIKKIIQ